MNNPSDQQEEEFELFSRLNPGSRVNESSGDLLAPSVHASSTSSSTRQFQRELRLMMYGFGDSSKPLDESVELMEELVMDHLMDWCRQSFAAASSINMNPSSQNQRKKLKLENFLHSIRKNPKKFARAEELLFRFDELSKARKAFDTSASATASAAVNYSSSSAYPYSLGITRQ